MTAETNLRSTTEKNIGLDWQCKGDHHWVANDWERQVFARIRRGHVGTREHKLYWPRIVLGDLVVVRSRIDVGDLGWGEDSPGFADRQQAMQWCEAKVASSLLVAKDEQISNRL